MMARVRVVTSERKKNQLQKTDDYSELKNMEKRAEFKVFIALVQEGATFDVWSPIQLSKAIHKEIGEVRSVRKLRNGSLLVECKDEEQQKKRQSR